jgi:hypothetical protein
MLHMLAKIWPREQRVQKLSKKTGAVHPKKVRILPLYSLSCTATGTLKFLGVKKKEKLHADYNSFWLSVGGEPCIEGHFNLPTRIARKPIDDIASKKRAEYRRCYALLAQLEGALASYFVRDAA